MRVPVDAGWIQGHFKIFDDVLIFRFQRAGDFFQRIAGFKNITVATRAHLAFARLDYQSSLIDEPHGIAGSRVVVGHLSAHKQILSNANRMELGRKIVRASPQLPVSIDTALVVKTDGVTRPFSRREFAIDGGRLIHRRDLQLVIRPADFRRVNDPSVASVPSFLLRVYQTGRKIYVLVIIVFEIQRVCAADLQTDQLPFSILKTILVGERPTIARSTIVLNRHHATRDLQPLEGIAKTAAFIAVQYGRVVDYRTMQLAVSTAERQNQHVLDDCRIIRAAAVGYDKSSV